VEGQLRAEGRIAPLSASTNWSAKIDSSIVLSKTVGDEEELAVNGRSKKAIDGSMEIVAENDRECEVRMDQ